MPSIAGIPFTTWEGDEGAYAPTVQRVARDGLDGVGLINLGMQREPVGIATGVRLEAGEVADVLRKIRQTLFTAVEVVNQFGDTTTGVIVTAAWPWRQVQPDGTVWLRVQWSLEYPVSVESPA